MSQQSETERNEETGADQTAREDPPHGGGGVGGQGGEGSGAAAATPDIGEEGDPGQTTVDAPDDDPGTPEEEQSRTD
jgi:hypothetical protein